jgi:hypothetical protein
MPDCPHCGNPMTPGGAAIACGPDGSVKILLAPYCADPACREARDEAALMKMIAAGVIDP